MFKACIFDFDGTIANSLESIAYSVNLTLKQLGLKPQALERYKDFVGNGWNMLLRRSLAASGDAELMHLEAAAEISAEIFKENSAYHMKLYPEIYDLLLELRSKGIKTAVLTNKPHERALDVIGKLFEADFFDIVLGQQPGYRLKPAPDGALYIAGRLNVKPQECLYLGDSGTDMQTANAAEMYAVGASWGFRPREELIQNGACVVINTPLELLSLLN